MSETKSILITGCSSGIGLAAADELTKRGYRVIASCRKERDVKTLKESGFEHVLHLDLANSQSIQSAVRQTLEICDGKLFALFNNGAYGLAGAVEDISRDALRRQFEANVFGTHELTCLLLPHMLKMPDARIIQNSSVLGFIAAPNRGAYVASKFALDGLSSTLRMELKGATVKCIMIEPGPIKSRFRENALKVFNKEINVEKSRHQAMYARALKRLERKEESSMTFTLGAEAVVKKLVHALESRRPKNYYRVTVPTHLMFILDKILPSKWLDAFIIKNSSP